MKKAQSALEFLTTYGWAFLVILIMIGALAYFGILNPSRYLPERCTVTPGFSCEEFQIARASDTSFVTTVILKNGLGTTVAVTGAGVGSDLAGATAPTCLIDGLAPAVDRNIAPDAKFNLTCTKTTSTTVPQPGNKQKVAFNITYVPSGKTLSQSISGEVFGALR